MRHILVTGANKGIGLALVEAILEAHGDTFVFLGARDLERGRGAAAPLAEAAPGRVEVVRLDVADEASVAAAKVQVAERLGDGRLFGLVNNAGIGTKVADGARIVETNTLGVRRVCEAFLPLLEPQGGRIVNVTSASGPLFVAGAPPEVRRVLTDPDVTWPALEALIAAHRTQGSSEAYGFSKACTNSYTMILARENPALNINACTPGYIATDMTMPAGADHKSASELGMKTPREGTHAPIHLLFDALEGNGRYYGSDARRSPLDRYRAPGSPAYVGP